MAGQRAFLDVDERYASLSAGGDPLERLATVIDFELFRAELDTALERSHRAGRGRPPYDPAPMFEVRVLQTLYTPSDDQTEYQIRGPALVHAVSGPRAEDRVPSIGAPTPIDPTPSACSASS